jgi:hypothetical protein
VELIAPHARNDLDALIINAEIAETEAARKKRNKDTDNSLCHEECNWLNTQN